MKLKKQEVIQELSKITRDQIDELKSWEKEDLEILKKQADNGGWSVLQCMEHLRRYMEVYLPEIKSSLANGRQSAKEDYRTGWIGNYSAQSMLPNHKRSRKMKTFASKNPDGMDVERSVLSELREQLEEMDQILHKSESYDWNRIKVKTTLGSWIRFNLGDIFRFLIYHNYRHFKQAQNVISDRS